MMRRGLPLLVLALAALGAPPARAEKTIAVTVGPWRFLSGPPPTGWTEPSFDDRGWSGPAAGPFTPRPPALSPVPSSTMPRPAPVPPGTLYDLVPYAPLLLRARFSVADATHVRVLELRVAYNDAFVAYVNGQEVARRGVVSNGTAAVGPHGPEMERLYIPVPSAALPSLRADGNLLAVAAYAAPGRAVDFPSAPAALVDVAAASGVRIVRGPYLSRPTDGLEGSLGLRLNWQTDLPATATVSLDRVDSGGAAPRRTFKVDQAATTQAATLGGLAPGASYSYRVVADGGGGDLAQTGPNVFKTLAGPSQPLRFAVYGDMRYPGHAAHRTIVDALVREAPALIINTGDLTDVGSEESNWQKYFEITAPMGAIAPVVPALGNHDADRRGAGAALTWSLFGVPAKGPPGWTSFDLGGVHFVILSTNEMRNPAQVAWLRDDLARARRHHPRAIFAFCHEGPWAHGLHGGAPEMARDYAPLLAAAHADVLFSGHDHIYERGVGTTPEGNLTYVVTGGGGAPLYNPSCRAAAGPPPNVPHPLPPCPASVAVLTNSYHYIMVEVAPDGVTLCPRHPDGSPVEPCVHLPPHGGHGWHGRSAARSASSASASSD
ncbi:MAG TPA: metallophosphoesterase family protein [Polyangia bacterium]|nr:metallophosphoesterase family protein [Polyangia bacterium]